MDPSRVIPQLPRLPHWRLIRVWKNAIRQMAHAKDSRYSAAETVAAAVEKEWQRRSVGASEGFFSWPTTAAPGGSGDIDFQQLQRQGMLGFLEYHVGSTHGEPAGIRRMILVRVFEGNLPPVFDRSYMSEWGQPKTPRRLQKLAECLAAFCRNAKRQHNGRMDDAIRDWEDDLEFLYNEFYVGRFGFSWPSTAMHF